MSPQMTAASSNTENYTEVNEALFVQISKTGDVAPYLACCEPNKQIHKSTQKF
jgi:hypothetical protein